MINKVRWAINVAIIVLVVFAAAGCGTPVENAEDPMVQAAGDEKVEKAVLAETPEPSEAEREHDLEIRKALQIERLAVVTVGMPEWSKGMLAEYEGEHLYRYARSRSVAWGTGEYKRKPFEWFAYSSSDGEFTIMMSAVINQADIDTSYGFRSGMTDAEKVEAGQNKKFHILAFDGKDGIVGTHTRIDFEPVGWFSEFCSPLNRNVCDAAGAFEKHTLPTANQALPGLSFTLGGRIPE